MLTIVLTNDDGVHAPGLNILKNTLSSIAHVIIVAPLTEGVREQLSVCECVQLGIINHCQE